MTRTFVPDYILGASQRILTALLPHFERTPGTVTDLESYARYRRDIRVLKSDTRAAARREDLADRIAGIAAGYRTGSSDMRAVIDGLERVAVASRAFVPSTGQTVAARQQAINEQALCLLFEGVALAEIGNAVANLIPRSHEEALRLRQRLGRTFDIAIERASDQGATDVQRALRECHGRLVRDLIERGRPLARVTTYTTAIPLPAVVLAHRLYQDAARADELRAENSATDHPAFMPFTGRAYSR